MEKVVLMIMPEFGYGGAEKVFCRLSVELSHSFKIKIVVFNKLEKASYPIGGEVQSLNVRSSDNILMKLSNLCKRIIRLRALKNKIKPDVTISFLEGADYINVLTKGTDKVICSIHGSKIFDQNISGISRKFRELIVWPWLYRRADLITTVSIGIRNELISIIGDDLKEKVIFVPNPIDKQGILNESYKNVPPPYHQLLNETTTLISIGRLAPEKGVHLFLPIFKNLVNENERLKYLIIGAGQYHDHLIDLCEQLKLSYHLSEKEFNTDYDVYFLGYVSNPLKYLARADVFIFPSTHEGYPNALIEAILVETVVIAADCPYGPRQILSETTQQDQDIIYPLISGSSILLPSLLNCDQNDLEMWRDLTKRVVDQDIHFENNRLKSWDEGGIAWEEIIDRI